MDRPPFPGKKASEEERRKYVEKEVQKFKYIGEQDEQVSLEEIENLPIGTYRLYQRPNVAFLATLPNYKNSTTEVGIYRINNHWLISLSSEDDPYANSGEVDSLLMYRADSTSIIMHSHPNLNRQF